MSTTQAINAKEMAKLYEMSYSNYHTYISPFKDKINALATTTWKKGKVVLRQNYNTAQLKFIIDEIFKGECPYGYQFDGKELIKRN